MRFSIMPILVDTLEPPMIAVKGRLISLRILSTAFTSFLHQEAEHLVLMVEIVGNDGGWRHGVGARCRRRRSHRHLRSWPGSWRIPSDSLSSPSLRLHIRGRSCRCPSVSLLLQDRTGGFREEEHSPSFSSLAASCALAQSVRTSHRGPEPWPPRRGSEGD